MLSAISSHESEASDFRVMQLSDHASIAKRVSMAVFSTNAEVRGVPETECTHNPGIPVTQVSFCSPNTLLLHSLSCTRQYNS